MRLNILSGIVGGEFSINSFCLVLHGLLDFSLWVGFSSNIFWMESYQGLFSVCIYICVCMCMSVHIIVYLRVSVRHCKRGVSVSVGETRGQPWVSFLIIHPSFFEIGSPTGPKLIKQVRPAAQ